MDNIRTQTLKNIYWRLETFMRHANVLEYIVLKSSIWTLLKKVEKIYYWLSH